ncbi:MAG: hypothetical protein ACQEWE_05990 [Bacillota bacterium]
MGPVEDVHLDTLCYQMDKNISEFSSEIHRIIGHGKNDGYSVHINSLDNIVFVRIELFGGNEYTYITDYLNLNGQEIDYPIMDVNKTNQLIQVSHINEKWKLELINELKNEFSDQLIITHSERIFEKGASDWKLDLLLWLSNIPASIISAYVYDFLKRKKSENARVSIIDQFDKSYVLEIAAKASGVSVNDLELITIDYDESNQSSTYILTSRYVDIKLTLNKSYEIIGYTLDKKTQLKI